MRSYSSRFSPSRDRAREQERESERARERERLDERVFLEILALLPRLRQHACPHARLYILLYTYILYIFIAFIVYKPNIHNINKGVAAIAPTRRIQDARFSWLLARLTNALLLYCFTAGSVLAIPPILRQLFNRPTCFTCFTTCFISGSVLAILAIPPILWSSYSICHSAAGCPRSSMKSDSSLGSHPSIRASANPFREGKKRKRKKTDTKKKVRQKKTQCRPEIGSHTYLGASENPFIETRKKNF
jgi:hypothetical protein